MRSTLAPVFAALLAGSGAARSESSTSEAERFRDMSLEQLLSVEVYLPATLTKLTRLESPAAVTTITAEDIRLTPVRNLYDLIEVYVPGATWMNHETGPLLGVRGSITNRNYKYLLLVDGRVMNNKSFIGASSELEMWDLGDIERVEIVRGPGSVTYGPGAVAGVISITTRRAQAIDSSRASVGFAGRYDSRSLTFSHEQTSDAFKLFAHGSIVDTRGVEAHSFQVDDDNAAGYVGRDYLPEGEGLDYFGDYDNEAQLKLHLTLDFADDWRLWSRYTQQGSYWFSDEIKTESGGELVNQEGTRSRQFTTAVEHDMTLSDTLSLSTALSFDSYDFERRKARLYVPDRYSPLNYQVDFAEHEILAHGLLHWQAADWMQIAGGAEWAHDWFGPGWSDNKREMRLGDSGEIINGADSLALHPIKNDDPNYVNRNSADRLAPDWPAIYVGSGWEINTTSLFVEADLAAGGSVKLLLSGRADQSTHSDWILSPRAAWIWTVTDGHVLKLIAQRASRMNTASQMFANAWHDIDNKPEKLDSLELRYSAQLNDRFGFDLSAFHNEGDVIAFQSADNSNRRVGNLKLHGLEGELHYNWERGRIGASFSWVKQQEFCLEPGVLSSDVSYSDYNLPIGGENGGIQVGTGNDINNWPNQSLKAFGHYRINDQLTVHADIQWHSELQGAKDGIEGLRNAVAGTPSATPAFYAALDRLAVENVYDSEVRFNALIEYAISPNSSVQLYGQNLLGGSSTKRYAYDQAGATKAAPQRVRFAVEPESYGVRVMVRF